MDGLRSNPEADIAYSYIRRYVIGQQPVNIPTERSGEAHTVMLPTFLTHRFWQTACPLYTRRISDRAGPWTDLPIWEDFEYDMRLAGLGAQLVHCAEFLVDIRDHPLDRLSRPWWFDDPDLLRAGLRAHRLFYEHARRGGMTRSDEEMSDLVAAVRFIWANCARLGLTSEEADCVTLMNEITGGDPNLAEPRLRAHIEPLTHQLVIDPGSTSELEVRVTNESSITFRSHVLPIGLSYHLVDDLGHVVAWDGPRVWFSPPLRPGSEQILTLPVVAPGRPGRYRIELDLVLEGLTWFKDAGSSTASLPLIVGSARTC